jgi:5-methyltetrahydropteroyltriglutamate--homocysteine methyltransferase
MLEGSLVPCLERAALERGTNTTMTARTVPPFRADHVGSFLRSTELKVARTQRELGEIDGAQLRDAEDAAIRVLVRKQEDAGLKGITDGDYRRSYWHFDFLGALGGVELTESGSGLRFQNAQSKPKTLRVTDTLRFAKHPHVDHFQFLLGQTRQTAKVCIPGPSILHFRAGRKHVSTTAYPTMEEFFHDLGQVYKQIVTTFGAMGCKYLQFDEASFSYLCDADQRAMLRARGDDVDQLLRSYADLIKMAVEGRPADMRITLHTCRGNFRSMWIAKGAYDPIADVLFNQVPVDGYFLEWDTERAGNFEPLRLLPKHKQVALGLVTTKSGGLEAVDELRRRIDEAAQFADLDQLSLAPQCGFASTEEGNELSEVEQWAKIARVVETARLVWGD